MTGVAGVADVREDDPPDKQDGSHATRLKELLDTDPKWARLLSVEGVTPDNFLKPAETTIRRNKTQLDAAFAILKEAEQEREKKLGSRLVTWSWYISFALTFLFVAVPIATGVLAILKAFGYFQRASFDPFLLVIGIVWVAQPISTGLSVIIERRAVSDAAVRYDHAQKEYDRKLFSLIAVPTARAAQTLRFIRSGQDVITFTEAPKLASRIEQDTRIETRSFRRVFINLRRVGGSTVESRLAVD